MTKHILARLTKLRNHLDIKAKDFAPIFLVILIYLLVSTLDFQEEVKSQQRYCSMVDSNTWPDYNKNYSTECQSSHV